MRILSDDEVRFAIHLFDSGVGVTDIAKRLHTRTTSVSKALKNNGRTPKQGSIVIRELRKDYFEQIDSEIKAYYVGLMFTDGSVTLDKSGKRAPNIRLELCETDYGVLYMFRDELGITSSLRYDKRTNRKNGTFTISVRSRELANSLSKYGIVPNKTYTTKSLPNIPDCYIPAFLHGLIDGDGSIYYSKGAWHVNFCSHSKNICEEFERMCSSLIGKERPMRVQCSDDVYRITYNGVWARKLVELCFRDADYGIARKRLLAMKACEDNAVEDIV